MSYEIHITINASDLNKKRIKTLVQKIPYGSWTVSNITDDPILGLGPRYYLTNHATNLADATQLMDIMWANLIEAGYKPIRRKIEHIVYDVRFD